MPWIQNIVHIHAAYNKSLKESAGTAGYSLKIKDTNCQILRIQV